MLTRQLFFVYFTILSCGNLCAEKLSVSIEAEAAILINAETGAILYEKNSHTPNYPASTTKVATALYALKEKGNQLSEIVTAEQEAIASISTEAKKRSNYTTPSHWVEKGSTHMGIKKGEEFTLKDLIAGVMIVSANDAANIVAQYTSGTIPDFITGMNTYVKSLGCKNTNFMNPHGLHHPKHQTTPFDMAIIAREAMKNPVFREMVASVKFIRPKTNKQESIVMLQLNRLLRTGKYYYPKAIGIKTGYTSIARYNLVAAAKDGNRELIAVLMNCDATGQVFLDAAKLFDAAFNQDMVRKIVLKAGPQKFTYSLEGSKLPLKTYLKEDLFLDYYPAEEPAVKCFLQWQSIKLPILKDQQVAELQLKTVQGAIIQKVPLYAEEEVSETWFQWLRGFF